MRKYLLDKKEEIKEMKVKERKIEFPETKNFIISVIGPRRAGKTYSIFNLIKKKKLKDEDYLFINFEDDEICEMKRKEIRKVIFYHQEIYGREPEYLFFDEIQNLERWESFVYSLFEKKRYFIFITGSSSKLLSEEIATQLRGRSLTILVLPFSFKEFLQVKGLHVKTKILLSYEESKIKNLLRLYLKEGGFPDIVLTSINREEYFRDYINLVVFRDIVERYKIRDIGLIKMFVRFAISSFSKEFSIHKIYRTFKSMNVKVSKKTLYRYADMLEDAQFCFFLRKFSFSERESLLSIPKVFLNDPGIANYGRTTKFDEEIGKLMENAVFLELKRKKLETFYWRDYQGNEVDFVVKEGLKVKQLIQVTYANDRDEIREREIKDLMKSSELLKCKDLLCITWDYEGEEKIKGKKVKFVPLWKWLMNI
ncbi:MAG: hypothetical protein B6D55_08810 [Candidatus Omnitrophica bacterium 4484_70.2]|nr:MAG: hypothetical protein B6D55_08810 [Candidatus Omnitrophica bacterium 4484_70.2]